MKSLLCLFYCVCVSLIHAQHNIIGPNAAGLKLKLTFSYASYHGYNYNYNRSKFLNDNLNFSGTENTLYSSLKVIGKIILGRMLGVSCAKLMKSFSNPTKDAVNFFISSHIQELNYSTNR